MKDFMLIFRREPVDQPEASSPEALQARIKPWMDWIGNIAGQNKLIDKGNSLVASGKVLRSGNVVTDGPYMELKEAVGGYTMIKAASLEEALELAQGCPILAMGGSVEVREINQM